MTKTRTKSTQPKSHNFRNKLLLNQWLLSLFGIDPLAEHTLNGKKVRAFHRLADPINSPTQEGLDADNLHRFYHALINSELFWDDRAQLSKAQLLVYEENIVRHTQAINERRQRPVVWKYYQWLTLLFVEIYLDRYFSDRERLLNDLNEYVRGFNQHYPNYSDVPGYAEDDLNKLCLQNATGSGKTLIMHINLLQYRHYAEKHGKDKELSRVILLTPNERLSEQHLVEFRESAIPANSYLEYHGTMYADAKGLGRVDVLEITKLADQEGPNTIAARSLGDQNLLLVDEGHRGMSGKDEGVWFKRRSDLCAKGFTFEYSATFEQAVVAAKNDEFENDYAKAVIFDYSYRWFYEDGFGKDYQILNLPGSFEEVRTTYLTACLLKFYQQLRIYEEKSQAFEPFNLEKPLWVFVGSTVSTSKWTSDEKTVATDVAQIVQFIANFLQSEEVACRRIESLLVSNGQDTGLLDKDNNDIFADAFTYLAEIRSQGVTSQKLYQDILGRLFNQPGGGGLVLSRIKGESGEVALRVGSSEIPFGLINVGDAKSLCEHLEKVAIGTGTQLKIEDSDFSEAMFASVKDSSSPVNLLIGSKKFVEGWDCWRVSTMGLMHVGKSEGTQIIQLFGRGVRLKGLQWSLKRSGHTQSIVASRPSFIEELETLNVFGVEADFMERFRDFLREEGLPGNERRRIFNIPLNVTYDFGKKLKIIRPKRKSSDGKEYDFKKDAPIPTLGSVPEYLTHNTVVADWYPRIQAVTSRSNGVATQKDKERLGEEQLALLDYDALYFELERFKRERSWHNLNISKAGIRQLLATSNWYTLYIPTARLKPSNYEGVLLLQQVAGELLKRYCDHYYNFCKREFIEPRLELRELTRADDNIPQDEFYQLIVDGDEAQVILGIEKLKQEIEQNKENLVEVGKLNAINFRKHLFEPLIHVESGSKVTILPVALNESEFQFVTDLKKWCETHKTQLEADGTELFLLRNMSRGKGVGFFEAGNFHPDFILWLLVGGKQYVTFIEPHGLLTEGPGSEKVRFYQRIKEIEKRLGDPDVVLNSFILSWTPQPMLRWGMSPAEYEAQHVLFMQDDRDRYVEKLMAKIKT